MRDEIHVIENLNISGDTVEMENLCRILSDILLFINWCCYFVEVVVRLWDWDFGDGNFVVGGSVMWESAT